MNTQQIITFTQNTENLSKIDIQNLDKIIQKFPFFQAARAIYLKGLYNENSYKYNFELKKTAAITTERNVLFEYITSKHFSDKNNHTIINNIIVNDFEIVRFSQAQEEIDMIHENISEINIQNITENTNEFNLKKDNHSEQIIFEISDETFKEEITKIEHEIQNNETEAPFVINFAPVIENLEIGKPIPFNQEEKYSFFEWLKISKINPIERSQNDKINQNKDLIIENRTAEVQNNTEKSKKNAIIDQFLITNPKISALKINDKSTQKTFESIEKTSLMTETLAKVYLEQKKYEKAIQAFQILILKNPEKSVYFANRIKDIKILQQNNI